MQTILKWFKIIDLPKSHIIIYFVSTFIETLCFLLSPVSFAYITNYILEQNSKASLIWAFIYFLTGILSTIIKIIKQNELSFLYNYCLLKGKEIYSSNTTISKSDEETLNTFIFKFNTLFIFLLKTLSIIILSMFYSIKLFVFLCTSLFLCLTVGKILFTIKIKNKNLHVEKPNFLNANTLVNILWQTLTFILILFTIEKVDNRIISLTLFLLIINFVSNHLTKTNFNIDYLNEIKILKLSLNKFDLQKENTKNMNKLQNSWQTKKNNIKEIKMATTKSTSAKSSTKACGACASTKVKTTRSKASVKASSSSKACSAKTTSSTKACGGKCTTSTRSTRTKSSR